MISWPFQSLPFDKLRANGLERRSSANFIRQAQDKWGERIEKHASDTFRFPQQAQDRQRHWKESLRKPKEIKNGLRTLF
jgi:hypothetical protein